MEIQEKIELNLSKGSDGVVDVVAYNSREG